MFVVVVYVGSWAEMLVVDYIVNSNHNIGFTQSLSSFEYCLLPNQFLLFFTRMFVVLLNMMRFKIDFVWLVNIVLCRIVSGLVDVN